MVRRMLREGVMQAGVVVGGSREFGGFPVGIVPEVPQVASPESGTHVLVVENDVVAALQLRMALVSRGYGRVEVASSGEVALMAMEQEFPDLLVLEVAMPNDGPGMQPYWRLPRYTSLPVVYVSARGPADGGAPPASSPTALALPLDEGMLHAAVQRALRQKRAEMADRNRSFLLFRQMEAEASGQC